MTAEILNIDAATAQRLLPFPELIAKLKAAFVSSCVTPTRHAHEIAHRMGTNKLLLMPAWNETYLGLKVVVVAPANVAVGLPSLTSTYTLYDQPTGRTLAIIDGNAITSSRTAAASALAASFLARSDAETMLVAGTGRVASLLPVAYRAVLPIKRVLVWSQSAARASALAEEFARQGFESSPCVDLTQGMQRADVVSCATLADRLIVAGKSLRPGMFVDLIGSFQPHSREVDDDAITRSKVVVDTTEALAKSGDLLIPIQGQVWSADRLHGTLADLCNGSAPGRRSAEEIFLFKSVGTALEDLTAAQMIYERARASC